MESSSTPIPRTLFCNTSLSEGEGSATNIASSLRCSESEENAITAQLAAYMKKARILGKNFREDVHARGALDYVVQKVMDENSAITNRVSSVHQGLCSKAFRALAKAESVKHRRNERHMLEEDGDDIEQRRHHSPTPALSLSGRQSLSVPQYEPRPRLKREYPVVVLQDSTDDSDTENVSCLVSHVLHPGADKNSAEVLEHLSWAQLLGKLKDQLNFNEKSKRLIWLNDDLAITVCDDDSLVMTINQQWWLRNPMAKFRIREKRRPKEEPKLFDTTPYLSSGSAEIPTVPTDHDLGIPPATERIVQPVVNASPQAVKDPRSQSSLLTQNVPTQTAEATAQPYNARDASEKLESGSANPLEPYIAPINLLRTIDAGGLPSIEEEPNSLKTPSPPGLLHKSSSTKATTPERRAFLQPAANLSFSDIPNDLIQARSHLLPPLTEAEDDDDGQNARPKSYGKRRRSPSCSPGTESVGGRTNSRDLTYKRRCRSRESIPHQGIQPKLLVNPEDDTMPDSDDNKGDLVDTSTGTEIDKRDLENRFKALKDCDACEQADIKDGIDAVISSESIGSTRDIITLRVVIRWLDLIFHEIDKSWAAKDGVHLAKHTRTHPQPSGATCPTAAKSHWFRFSCPCVAGSPAENMRPKPGPCLIISPAKLIINWLAEIKKAIDFTNLNFQVRVCHGQIGKRAPLTAGDIKELRWNEYGKAKVSQSRFLLLTSPLSFKSQLAQKFEYTEQSELTNGSPPAADEIHEEKKDGTTTIEILRLNYHSSHKWFLSGTPIEMGPADIQAYIGVLEQSYDIQKRPELQLCTSEKIAISQAKYTRALTSRNRQEFKDIALEFQRILEIMMLRRTMHKSKWFGQLMVYLPPHYKKVVSLQIDSTYKRLLLKLFDRDTTAAIRKMNSAMNIWRAKGSKPKDKPANTKEHMYDSMSKSRICTSLPGLLTLENECGPEFTTTEMMAKGYDRDDTSPYLPYLDQITQKSVKIAWLKDCIRSVLKEGCDNLKPDEKLVIATRFGPVAKIIALWLKHKMNETVAYFNAGHTFDERQDMVDAFQEQRDDAGQLLFPQFRPRFIVSTKKLIGTGYTLTSASKVILFEPDFVQTDEVQTEFRASRLGQKADCTRSIMLVVDSTPLERGIIDKAELRAEFGATSFGRAGEGEHRPIEIEDDEN
ncbi:MAG: hypothetical protein Q9187_005830 [Circinaria calcarea]